METVADTWVRDLSPRRLGRLCHWINWQGFRPRQYDLTMSSQSHIVNTVPEISRQSFKASCTTSLTLEQTFSKAAHQAEESPTCFNCKDGVEQ
jgi:hypothetical protein